MALTAEDRWHSREVENLVKEVESRNPCPIPPLEEIERECEIEELRWKLITRRFTWVECGQIALIGILFLAFAAAIGFALTSPSIANL